jgi:glycerol-3-phosphate dehydrogenase (NAD(P)+)
LSPRNVPATPAATKVAVLGAGSWGTTFGKILADGGSDVAMWARRPELAREITEAKRNSDYLPGINLPMRMTATASMVDAVRGAAVVFLSVPSQSLRDNLIALRPHLEEGTIVVSLMKGVERRSGSRMSEVIRETLDIDPSRIAVASGPNLALEIAREQPTAAVISSESLETAQTATSAASSTPT